MTHSFQKLLWLSHPSATWASTRHPTRQKLWNPQTQGTGKLDSIGLHPCWVIRYLFLRSQAGHSTSLYSLSLYFWCHRKQNPFSCHRGTLHHLNTAVSFPNLYSKTAITTSTSDLRDQMKLLRPVGNTNRNVLRSQGLKRRNLPNVKCSSSQSDRTKTWSYVGQGQAQ